MLPEQANRAYPSVRCIDGILDEPIEELQAKWAPNIVIGLGRLAGRSLGVVANNPLRLGGCLDSQSAEKASRFVRMCDAFGIPLLVVVDVPGYLPGVGQEWDGVVRRGAKLLHAFAEAVVPRVTLVTRKAYGGAYIAMNSSALGATAVFAWPDAEIAVMGAKAAVGILHRRKLAAAPDERAGGAARPLAAEHEKVAGGVHRAIELGVVDEVITPAADPAPGRRSAGLRTGRPRQPRQHPACEPPFPDTPGSSGRRRLGSRRRGRPLRTVPGRRGGARRGRPPEIACVVLDEGDGSERFDQWSAVLRTVADCVPRPVLVPLGAPLIRAASWPTRTGCWSAAG